MKILKYNNFIERSIMGALAFLKNSVFSEEYAQKKGLLQSVEPRSKVLGIFLFVIVALFIKDTFLLLCLYALCLLLAHLSRINLGFFLKRTLIFIPLFSLFIALPALFNVFSPGQQLFSFNMLSVKLIVTRQGVASALLFVARVTTSVSLVVLLTLTTKHFELLRSLRVFGVPQVFVVVLGMCYRYIYLFVEVIENSYLAIKSRVGIGIRYQKGQRIVGWHIASLWNRSVQLNQEVYSAMLSRGFSGETVLLNEFVFGLKDFVWLFFAIAVCVLLMFIQF